MVTLAHPEDEGEREETRLLLLRGLFKECITWRKEIRTLWKEIGLAGGSRKDKTPARIGKGRKGFGYQFCGGARPGNTTVGGLLSD